MNSEEIGMTSLCLGAGRTKKGSKIDMSAGIVIEREIGESVNKGDIIMTLYSSTVSDFSEAAKRAVNSLKIG